MAHTTAVRVQHAPTPPAHASASASPSRPRRHATDLTRQNRGRIRTGGTPAGTESRVNNEKRCEIRERASWSTPLAPSEEKGPHERTCAGDEQYGFCWVLAASCCLIPTWHGAVRPSARISSVLLPIRGGLRGRVVVSGGPYGGRCRAHAALHRSTIIRRNQVIVAGEQ
jgi:hypothetical protein